MEKISSRTWLLIEERKNISQLLSMKLEDVKYLRAKLNKLDKEIKGDAK